MQANGAPEGQILLKTSFFGGFDKTEVLGYIDSLRKQNNEMEKRLEERMRELSLARSQFAQQAAGFEQKLSEMESRLEERAGKIRELTGAIDTLQGELARHKQAAADAGSALEIQKEQNRQFVRRLQDIEHKARRYDDVSARIGDILIDARRGADDLLSTAQAQAGQITAGAQAASDRIVGEMCAMRGDLMQIRGNFEEMMQAFLTRLDEVGDMLDKLEHRVPPDGNDPDESDTDAKPAAPADEFFRVAAQS